MKISFWTLLVGCAVFAIGFGEEESAFLEKFDDDTLPEQFLTAIPNKNTSVRDGALWTRGESGGKYPPMVYLGVEGKDLEISFRYRHLQPGGMIWFFVDGDDGYGSVDHMLRVKLQRSGVQLQIDHHTLDADHPERLNRNRPADKVSGAYRLNKKFPTEKIDLSADEWHTVTLKFRENEVTIRIDDDQWVKTVKHDCFNAQKRKLLWMQKGGEKGIELDDIRVPPLEDLDKKCGVLLNCLCLGEPRGGTAEASSRGPP